MEYSQEWFNQNIWWFMLLILWDLIWSGWALWLAARNNHKVWFVVLLLINTIGILPILYVLLVNKKHKGA